MDRNNKHKYPLHPLLRNYIEYIYFVPEVTVREGFIPVMPDCMTELVISLRGSSERNFGSGCIEKISRSHFVGMKSRSQQLKLGASLKKVGIRFKPGGALMFADFDMNELTDCVVDASEIFSNEILELENKIGESSDVPFIIKNVEDFLIARYKANQKVIELREILKIIYDNPAETKIENIKERTGTYYKQLERSFSRVLGIHPKLFMRIVKFNYATKLIYEHLDKPLTEIAYESGYYDQSHFIKTFKELSGMKPKDYFPFSSPRIASNQAITNRLFHFLP